MAFRVLNQISSIRQITTKSFRSLSADRSSIISITPKNDNAVAQEFPQQSVLHNQRRSLSQPPTLIRNYSSSNNPEEKDISKIFLTSKEKKEQELGTARDKVKEELVQTVLSQQEFTQVVEKKTFKHDDIPRFILSCSEEKFNPDRLDHINQQKTMSLMTYAKSKSSLQPNNMNHYNDVYKTELIKTLKQKGKPFVGVIGQPKRYLSTAATNNIVKIPIDYFKPDLIEKTQRHILKLSRDGIHNELSNVATNKTNVITVNLSDKPVNKDIPVNTSIVEKKSLLGSNILENFQKRQISTFYDYEDPDCPRPKVKIAEQPKTCLTDKFVDKNPWPDCPPPPEMKPPPLIPLPRMPKRPIPERRIVCPVPEVCPPRADVGLKVKEKTLPCLSLGNCPCIDLNPLKEGCPLTRLKKRPVPIPPIPIKCLPQDPCPPRADANYKIKMKELPCLVPGDCDCIIAPLKEGLPLPRLKAKPVPPQKRTEVCEVEDPCPPRADEGLKVKPKKLRCLVPTDCPCIEPPLRERNPLPRLKKHKVCEPIRGLECSLEDPCPKRADDLCNYRIYEKKLPTMILCQNNISAWEFNHPKRKFSTFAASNLLLRENSVESDAKSMSQKYIKHICKANIAKKNEKNKPCQIVCPDGPKCAPRIRRLVKRNIEYITEKKDLDTSCEAETCQRSDENINFSKRKSLPIIECNNCPKVEPCSSSCSQPLKRLVKRFSYEDPVRNCDEGCDPEMRIDYHMPEEPKKKLPPLEPKCTACIEPHFPTCCPKLRRLVKRFPTDDPFRNYEKPGCQIESCERADLQGEVKKKQLPCLKPKCGIPPCQPIPTCSKLKKLKKRFHYKDPERICEGPCDLKLVAADSLCGYEVKKKKLKPLLPCLPNALHQYRHFHTTIVRDRKQKTKKKSGTKSKECKKMSSELKSTCVSFKVNCPPRARQSCKTSHTYKDCQKQNSPYKSFAECANHDIIETITECPKVNYLQPRYPIIPPITVLKAPPPKHAHIDPKAEEMCIMKRLCMENKGVTYDCDSFNKPKFPLRQMDIQGPERVPCPDPIEEDLKKCRKQKDRPCKEVEPKCPEVSYKICENDVCSKPQPPPAEQSEMECQAEKEKETQEKPKEEKKGEKDDCKELKEEVLKCLDVVKCEEAVVEVKPEAELCPPPKEDICDTKTNVKTISPTSVKPIPRVNAKSHCSLLKPIKCEKGPAAKTSPPKGAAKKCSEPKSITILDRIVNYFKARPDCPSPDDWKKRALLEQAEKAAKAVGMELCKPKSTSIGKCKSFKAPEISNTKCPTAEEVCKKVCENALKQHLAKKASTKQKSDCMSKCNYSKSTSAQNSQGSKKCKVPTPDCGQKGKESKKAKKDDYKRESTPACGSKSPTCGKPPVLDPCHTSPYHNCPKKVERSCTPEHVNKDCCYIRPPYDCFSDMKTRFPRLSVNECTEQEARIHEQRDNPIKPQEKKKKKSKEDECKRSYSTYSPMSSFSTSLTKSNGIKGDSEFNGDYSLTETISNELFIDEFGDIHSLAEYEELFYDHFKCK